jgi:hypothetical protein
MDTNLFEAFANSDSDQELTDIQRTINEKGYSGFRPFLYSFKEMIQHFRDEDIQEMEKLMKKAKKWFPSPVRFSPSWERIWEDLEQTITYKTKILQSIPANDREGEWQIIMDNPLAIQEVVCYPGLTFIEAAYYYGYFGPQLEKNEYLRLQKIHTVIIESGS